MLRTAVCAFLGVLLGLAFSELARFVLALASSTVGAEAPLGALAPSTVGAEAPLGSVLSVDLAALSEEQLYALRDAVEREDTHRWCDVLLSGHSSGVPTAAAMSQAELLLCQLLRSAKKRSVAEASALEALSRLTAPLPPPAVPPPRLASPPPPRAPSRGQQYRDRHQQPHFKAMGCLGRRRLECAAPDSVEGGAIRCCDALDECAESVCTYSADATRSGVANFAGDGGRASFFDAHRECAARGKRLCSADEVLLRGACCGSGCHFDQSFVWTSTACRAQPPPPPAPPLPPPPPPAPFPYELFTGWPKYRLGDMVLWDATRGGKDGGEAFHQATWPDSIASTYLRATRAEADYRVLARIVRPRIEPANAPPPNAVVVHLRVGDVLDLGAVEDGDLNRYVYPLSFYARKLPLLPGAVRHAVLCAGAQFRSPKGYPLSSAYIDSVKDFFRARGFSVDLRLGRKPDDDVAYASHARYFIQSGGGFSQVIAGIVEEMGGQVFSCGPLGTHCK